jgi:hypothetical protein
MFVLTLQGTFMSTLTISTVIRLLAYVATCVCVTSFTVEKRRTTFKFQCAGRSGDFTDSDGVVTLVAFKQRGQGCDRSVFFRGTGVW